MKEMNFWRTLVVRLVALLLVQALAFAADAMPPKYREWLDKDVAYIITKEERDLFVRLGTDNERDKFIDKFWELRNPSPGAPVNTYKVEHYNRIAYANQMFGKESGTEGWRTDMGRTYITLGPPQQRAPYKNISMMRPMEIWFYQSPSQALPPFFYVLFYQRDGAGAYRYYSPYSDGPEKLVSPASATENNARGALNVIDRALGREVARTSLSLIPDEPVDFANAKSSLQSDIMLGRIRNLANDPVTKTELDRRRAMIEHISSRVIFDEDFVTLFTAPLRDSAGRMNLHYLLRLNRPQDFAVAEAPDGRYYYSTSVVARVMTSDSKPIFGLERKQTHYLDKKELDQVKGRTFAFEGWLPLAPGKYKIEFMLNNGVTSTAFRAVRDVVVPEVTEKLLQIAALVPFSDAQTINPSGPPAPFSAAGVRFIPMAGADLRMEPHGVLKFFYQLWEPGGDPESRRGKKLQIEYAYGRPGVRGDHKVIADEVSAEQFDPGGSLVNGKRIPLPDSPGNYMLNVTVTDPETHQKAFASMKFQLTDRPDNIEPWEVFDDQAWEEWRNGTADYQRALCYLANKDSDHALPLLRESLRKNPAGEAARGKLVDFYYAKQDFAAAATLATTVVIGEQTSEQTLLRMAESLEKTGDLARAISLLEAAVPLKPSSGPICLALASYYQRSGDTRKASEMERKGKSLMAPSSTSP